MRLDLRGLVVAPPQIWGTVRLVPLVREEPVADLRMATRDYGKDQLLAIATIAPGTQYLAYIPHGLVMCWSQDGSAVAAVDTGLGARDVQRASVVVPIARLTRGLGRRALRLLPLHVAIEGYLALHFGGPNLAHEFWSRRALRDGLSPRVEGGVRGASVPGLGEALRVFERHRGQCGMLVFIGEHLASALVVGHPDDYAALHDILLTDLFGSLFAQRGWSHRDANELRVRLDGESLPAIRASLDRARREHGDLSVQMAAGLFPRQVQETVVRKAGRFRLVRFATGFDIGKGLRAGEHIGEALVDADRRLVYLKTYRLDRGQIRRGYLLSELARVDWDPERLAAEQGHGDLGRVITDLDDAKLGWMVRNDWRQRLGV